ncbi:MAG TPA: Pls/PosA family non-ribosomal peptide synthetase [Jatrophihabitans sp.]|nr:Pls/PosA family non-ribosomal peptide synthetase [Jatrophihabitans sp.]
MIDIVIATASAHPDAAALDDGHTTLTYAQLLRAAESRAGELAAAGVRRGDRVGLRMPSGNCELYVCLLAILAAGACYVPVDVDDPDERARLVFGEAGVACVLDELTVWHGGEAAVPPAPDVSDDAWVIFTSGSTGVPKGVAVSHRSAAAFVDAEARMFLQFQPIGPDDRVLAGLSVAFDASCEEIWLAWRHGACLVPAPRSLVRSGVDLGGWLGSRRITVVSTVPTLAALWPIDSLDGVRLLIFGGESCPPELAERLVGPEREVWNTYGPTEATVVACAAELTEDGPVRIGLPLDGWDLAVVDEQQLPVTAGQVGELIIGGVGLARYLDPVRDGEKFAAMPSLGWDRAYRTGDLVRYEPEGLLFVGRADDQVKIGGRRIELGEVDAAMQRLPMVAGAAAAVRRTGSGNQILVGYLVPAPGARFDRRAALEQLRRELPAPLVPTLAVLDSLPSRVSGKVDRDALPWPLPGVRVSVAAHGLTGTEGWLAEQWAAVLGASVGGPDDDFFAHGGGSLAAAQLVSAIRRRSPSITVADVYAHPRLADLARVLDAADAATDPTAEVVTRTVRPVSRTAQSVQLAVTAVVSTLAGLRWLTLLATANNLLAHSRSFGWAPAASWWWVGLGWLLFLTPFGRMAIAAAGARLLLLRVRPGDYPRGGSVHLRLWSAERLADAVDAANLAGAPWIAYYARALGATVGRGVTLHTVPPITGMLTLGRDSSVEPEVDLAGYWLDGDVLRLGRVTIGDGATVRSRSTLGPGAEIGRGAEVAHGSWVSGPVPDGESWGGSPAVRLGRAVHGWPPAPPRKPWWLAGYGLTSLAFWLLPAVAALPAAWWARRCLGDAGRLSVAAVRLLLAVPVAAIAWLVCYALLTVLVVRLLGIGLRAGHHPVRSRLGWQVWATERLLDSARSLLFPLYSSLVTPGWLRLLGAEVGRGVEASTVLLLPRMTSIGDGAFLADDTMVGSYELGGGYLRVERAKIGKRAFLGNSGTTGPGRSVPKNALVAVLSTAPDKARKGSSWLGSPPVQLRRSANLADLSRTFSPPPMLRVARALIEVCRVAAVICTAAIGLAVLLCLQALASGLGFGVAAALGGLVLLAAGALAGTLTCVAKWLLVGRTRAVRYPLWSSFVWRNEVVDSFVELVAAPWFARAATGTAVLNLWLRCLGSRIGRGAWLETYWLPEADLIEIGPGASVNRGCVLQTHLFHDRILQMDTVLLGDGATLGPHSVILPGASIGSGATIGPSSLVMRAEAVPAHSRWIGNPISPWTKR